MQATRMQLALVIDEYGGTDGLVSIEDIVEQIVGDIADEHDDDVMPEVTRQADGSFIADARAPLEHVTAMIGADFDVGAAAKEIDTIGGYLTSRAGRVPVRGELVSGPGLYEIEVAEADPRRVKRVRIYKLKERRDRTRDQRRRSEIDAANTPPISASETAGDTKQRP
jgi:CBS domain containing-hemolysin-like protein